VGLLQDHVLRPLRCIWFNREQAKDRRAVADLCRAHARDERKNGCPLLVFPEGTCVNNEYVVQFKKGVFELGVPINPIAIKYNKVFVDAYWNSREQSFLQHLLRLMTSWAVVVDVWFLDQQTIRAGESAEDFATRVQRLVAALDSAVSGADTALSERRKAQSDATAAVVKDMQRLVGDSRDWEFRARNAETELERLRGELERARGAAGDGGVSDVRESGQGRTGEGDLQMSPTAAAARSQQPPRRSRLTREPTAAGMAAAESTEEEDAMRAAAENNAALPAEQWASFAASWDAFCSNPPSTISQADIPWPDIDVLEQLYMCGDAKAVDAKKLRADWHPDKFTQKFGSRLAPEERESILRAVTDLAGRINAMGLV
jgi:hypothetical protein